MAGKKITVVLSQAQGKDPRKRQLEEEIAAACIMDPAVDFSVVPHLYDLPHDHTGMLFLRSVPGNLVVLSWLYPRAAHWTLDRAQVKGHIGKTTLETEESKDDSGPENPDILGATDLPDRRIYCMDLRDHADPKIYVDEIKRISKESSIQTVDLMDWIQGSPNKDQLQQYLQPSGNGDTVNREPAQNGNGKPSTVKRRWYPVIDYSRCTNCMECIDFCLFGVYGLDDMDRILVEEQDNCKKGCPACSRVCPENAILFPEYKTPAIAGASDGEAGNVKIDLSKLFGAPSALEVAAQERDAELVQDGRDAVGMTVGIPKRQSSQKERDDLDDLMDDLDNLDL